MMNCYFCGKEMEKGSPHYVPMGVPVCVKCYTDRGKDSMFDYFARILEQDNEPDSKSRLVLETA